MKAPVQLVAILVLMAAGGTVYNFANSGDPTKYLNWFRPQAPEVEPRTTPAPPAGDPAQGTAGSDPEVDPDASTEFPMVGTAETLEELEAGSLIIDARRTKVYQLGHIPGARSISPWEADMAEKIAGLVDGGAIVEAPVVVYCNNSKECEDSKMIARQLQAAGFVDVKIYQGGFPSWKEEQPDKIVEGSEPGAWAP